MGPIPAEETSNIIEGQIGYVIDSYATRFALGFLYQKPATPSKTRSSTSACSCRSDRVTA